MSDICGQHNCTSNKCRTAMLRKFFGVTKEAQIRLDLDHLVRLREFLGHEKRISNLQRRIDELVEYINKELNKQSICHNKLVRLSNSESVRIDELMAWKDKVCGDE